MRRFVGATAIIVFAVACWGCGPGGPTLGKVTGQVTLDGKPLPNAVVTFMPDGGGGTASGNTDANGNYELSHTLGKGAPIGKNKVAVTTLRKPQSSVEIPQISSDSPEYAKMIAAGGSEYNVQFTEPVPAKYNANTELQFEVKSGTQVINLELKSS